MVRAGRRQPQSVFILSMLILLLAALPASASSIFRCAAPDGTVLYQDHDGPGCQTLDPKPSISIIPKGPTAPVPSVTPPPASTRPTLPAQLKAPQAVTFIPNSRIVHTLGGWPRNFSQTSEAYNALPGGTTPVTILVKPLTDGSGPKSIISEKFGPTWKQSAAQATLLAAQTVTLSPSTLEVTFTIEASFAALKYVIGTTEGPSAGGLLTVGVIAALLDDPIDPTVCMTGTINQNLTIGRIGAIPQKMLGCKGMKGTRMLIPYGQADAEARRVSLDTGIELIEIRSLAEAYGLMTGKLLRPITAAAR